MSDKTNEDLYRAYLLAYACSGDASKVAVLQDARPLTSAVAAALALAERDRQAGEPPDTWDSLTERLQAMFDTFDPNGYDLATGEEEDEDLLDDEEDEDGDEPIAS
ncbi:hypothetical protein SOCEGT47_068360 [Sorangium cellulosum]|jgi:hypothetical protein|uniref:Uncharacterized protein n=1 Tax=Sorangium cellulosum TaxID=56 RepID=A0A4P2Q9K8_SORCE|nr:hypothetical protein [Sorangium cellulosum]AUX26275.1 hypothetical protein SOCEGT47_068360 [Sorangium cellulosum]